MNNKKCNLLCTVFMSIGLLLIIIYAITNNVYIRRTAAIIGIISVIVSIIFEKKAKNPKSQNFEIWNIISKSKKKKKN